MKNLLCSSLILILLAGCVSIKPGKLYRDKVNGNVLTGVTRYTPPTSSYLFKATLDIKKHHLSGLLVVKRMTDSLAIQGGDNGSPTYRVVFMNEIGMTFLDLELAAKEMRVVSCFESLNKKALMKILETDLRVLNLESQLSDPTFYHQELTGNQVIKGKSDRYNLYQTYSPGGDTLLATSAKTTIADPVRITYEKYVEGFPSNITIENPFIGLKLVLKRLSK